MAKFNIVSSALLTFLLAGGCNQGFQGSVPSGNTSSNATSSKFEQKDNNLPDFTTENIEITFWHTMGDSLQKELAKIIADFNAIYPNITVTATQIGGYPDVRDAVLKNIPVNTTPNLAYCYPDHVALYKDARAVQSLDDYITDIDIGLTKEQRENYIEGFYQEGASFGDGKMYSMPFVKSTELLYYDATYFAQNNLKVPTTWDELWDVCRAIKAKNPNCIPFGYDSEANWFITNAQQKGYDYTSNDSSMGLAAQFRFNNKGNRDFVTDLKAKYTEGLFTTETMYGKYTSGLFTATTNKSYLGIGSSAGASYQFSKNFELGIASIPQTTGGNPAVISQGPSICMFDKANVQEEIASWLFLKFITTDAKSQGNFGKASGYMPVMENIAEVSTEYKAYLDGASGTSSEGATALAAKVATAQSELYFTSPTFVGSSQARDEVGNIIVNVLKGTEVQKAFDDAVQACIEAVS